MIAERDLRGAHGFVTGDGSRVFPGMNRPPARSSLYLGEAGVWAAAALVADAFGDQDAVALAVARFASTARPVSRVALDVMTGASGLLLGSALLIEQLPARATAPLLPLADRLVARLRAAAAQASGATAPPRHWLGAAHGWCGLAHAQLRWCQATKTSPAPPLRELLDSLARARRPTGLWPRRSESDDVWRGWCHGSAGWTQLWTLADEVVAEVDFLPLAASAAVHAVAGGGGAGLCCGLAGEAYAALALHRSTGDAAWLNHARRLALRAEREPTGEGFPEHSLWRGDVGVALLALELDDPTRAAMPLYRALC